MDPKNIEEAKLIGFKDSDVYLEQIICSQKNKMIRQVPDPLFEKPDEYYYDILAFNDSAGYNTAVLYRMQGKVLHSALLENAKIDLKDVKPALDAIGVMGYFTKLLREAKKERIYEKLCGEFGVPFQCR